MLFVGDTAMDFPAPLWETMVRRRAAVLVEGLCLLGEMLRMIPGRG